MIAALAIFPSSGFDVSFPTQAISVRRSTLHFASTSRRRNIFLHLECNEIDRFDDGDDKYINVLDSIELSSTDEEGNTTEPRITPSKDPMEQMIDAFVSIKEQAYQFIRKIFSDLITIIKRSATKARDWAVEDDVGQLVSSALFIIGFYAGVAAFAAWNIEVLSGGKSKWAMPQNGITMPVVKTPESPSTEISFQKPKWTVPKIQTSYTTIGDTIDTDSILKGQ